MYRYDSAETRLGGCNGTVESSQPLGLYGKSYQQPNGLHFIDWGLDNWMSTP